MMNRKTKYRIFISFLTILIFSTMVWPQVPVERSKDKIVISGVTCYLHIVKKGETIYSISKAYGITSEELTRENPPALNGLKEGQSLMIPEKLVTAASFPQTISVPQPARDESRFVYHRLQPGETIYFLSKKYSVSENEIIQSNPGIDINKLPLGYEIAIPRIVFMNEKENFANQQTKPYYHKVINGETMASIARKYGLPVRELRRENRDMRFPQVGDYLRIPGMKIPEERPVIPVAADTVPVTREEQAVLLEKPSGYTPVSNLRGSYDIAVLLPFYLSENSRRTEIDSSKSLKGKKIYNNINRSDDWIYPRSLGFVEMYEGILLAADTLRALGLNINVHVFDIKNDTVEVVRLIRSGKLDNMNLIIGPVHSGNLSIVASYAGSLGIPVVSPVQLSNNSVLENNPFLFMASSSLEVTQNAIAKKMGDYYNRNIVLIHSGSDGETQDISKFRNMILNELSYKMPFEEIRLKDMVFYSRSVFGNDSINRLAHTLSDRTGNVIIIASEDTPVMSESITDIHTLSRKFDLNVFGYPNMRYLDNLDHKICFDLGLMIYSPDWIDYSQQDIIQFNSDFRAKFLTEPSEMSYAWQGYDIIYYFISGLAIHGKEFISHPEIHNPDLLHTEYEFRRRTSNDGFENQKLFLVRYSNSYELELVNDEESALLK
ncbi:MAG: LysM peptidoglycan-binding domain-containing protein [Bacteroidia bacterium]|nr:LysM peptidoglycan-binding domain-containing protein [Bacteroidia bacterium]